ncbi:MAG TPA: helix-hairpin-helix domain-containing protein [Saprospiraceae bacterium]|nr:helix-hairpin-helix domain-containing protein [Saprospiraceae bacterium]
MTNKEIALIFNKLAKIMELHGENPFKIRSYYNAYNTLRKMEAPLIEMDEKELAEIPGVGKAITEKIIEFTGTGHLKTYQKYTSVTPPGVIEMLEIRGFGPKKIGIIWKELGIETIGELIYAIQENRLLELKGFGEKTQDQLSKELQYFLDSRGKLLYYQALPLAEKAKNWLDENFPDSRNEICGMVRRKMPVIDVIDIITTVDNDQSIVIEKQIKDDLFPENPILENVGIRIASVGKAEFGNKWLELSASEEFLNQLKPLASSFSDENEVWMEQHSVHIPPECREFPLALDFGRQGRIHEIINYGDIKGVIHAHTTFSDGIHSVEEMALKAKEEGFEYLVITDHSKAAFYANGLTEARVWEQFEEIDRVNQLVAPFKVYKGIEADILPDGSMDYNADLISAFDIVIASVHSGLKMEEIKATSRLIRAIENPNTHILGHPTGRLLLSREGYPIDHFKVIDACAEKGMVIELNANPLRLDLDWSWIPYAMEKGVKISINPDSHNRDSFHYINYGIDAARKGLLLRTMCLNAMNLRDFDQWVRSWS